MRHYFRILFDDDPPGVAMTEPGSGLIFLPERIVDNWKPLTLQLRDGVFADYQGSDASLRLCSQKLRDLLTNAASENDKLQWLDVLVQNEVETRPYYALHFPEPPDVLHPTLSTFGYKHSLIRPVISLRRAAPYKVFTVPDNMGLILFVSRDVKKLLEDASVSGMQITPLPEAE